MARRKRKPGALKPQARGLPWLQTSLPALHPPNRERDWICLALLFTAAFALYAVSTPRTVMLEDDGLFIAAANFAGVAHPPGYPLYVVLGWLASHVPFGSIAWRVHCLSGLMGAVTCICIAWLVLRRTGNRPAAYIAAAALAVSEHFWSQAIIADVYTTNTAVLLLTLVLVQEAACKRDTKLWIAAAALYGLGLANHWPLLVLGSPVLLAPVIAAARDFRNRIVYLLPVTLLAAAMLYGWMVWRSHQSPAVNFLGPIESWSDFLAFIGRDIYGGVDTSVNAGLTDKAQYAGYFISQALRQFSLPGGIIALWGMAVAWRRGWRLGFVCETAALLGSSFILIAWLDFDYEYFRVAAFRPYLLVAYCIFALWLGYGLSALIPETSTRRNALTPALHALSAIVIAALAFWNGGVNYRPHDRFAQNQAQVLLDLVEPDSVLVLYGDAFIFPAAYLHLVEGKRPDIRMMEAHGLLFNDRIVQPSWSRKQRNEAWAGFFDGLEQTAYFQKIGSILARHGQQHVGFLEGVDRNVEAGRMVAKPSDVSKAYFKKLAAMENIKDKWVFDHRSILMEIYGNYLGFALALDDPQLNRHIRDVMPLAQEHYWTLVGMAAILATQNDLRNVQAAEGFLRQARTITPGELKKSQQAKVFYLEGLVQRKKGNRDRAIDLFLKSVEINRSPANPSHNELGKLIPPPNQNGNTRRFLQNF